MKERITHALQDFLFNVNPVLLGTIGIVLCLSLLLLFFLSH